MRWPEVARVPLTDALEEHSVRATYTFDVFASLDGHASYGPPGDWGGYWG
jgi:hypothetical protein